MAIAAGYLINHKTMTTQNFSAEDSLRLIHTMIEKAKKDVSGDSFFLLLWGWLIFFAAIAQYVLMVIVKWPYHYMAWNLMWIGAIISIVYGIRHGKKTQSKTYIGETMKYFGIGCGITFTLLAFFFGYHEMWTYIFPIYFIFYGFLSFVSGAILQFPPLKWAAIACWMIAVIAMFVKFDTHLLLMAAAVLIAYILPGYSLKAKYKKMNNVQA